MSGFDKDAYLDDLPDPDDAWMGLSGNFHAAGRDAAGADGPAEADGNAPYQTGRAATGAAGDKAGDEMSSESEEERRSGLNGAESGGRHVAGNVGGNDVNDAKDANGAVGASDGDTGSATTDTETETANTDSTDASASAATDTEGADTSAADADGKGDETLTPLGQAKKEAADYLEALQRERAEFVNFRNRTKKEQDTFRQHGIIDVLTALLPALDDIDRIREHDQLGESFEAVATKIDKTFEKFGVEKFGEKGEDFDPTKHEAILHKPDPSATKETVDTVVEAGYRIGDRVIRAARVVVASPQA
jgi:molecular chaperone GrpE